MKRVYKRKLKLMIMEGLVRFKKNNNIKKFLRKNCWITIQSDNPFVNGWYIERSDNGIVGADHLF